MQFWLFLLVLLMAVAGTAYGAYRVFMVGDAPFSLNAWFAPKPVPRLGVSEQANIDGRRKLLLVRRDDVEHLLLIGGPVDIVIEEKIQVPRLEAAETPPAEPAGPVFTRQPRGFGQAVNE